MGHITDIDDAAMLSADLVHAAFHKSLHPASRGEVLLAERWSHDKTWADRHNLELLVLGQGLLEVPSSLLGKDLGLGISAETFRSIWVAPVALIEGAVSWLVSLSEILNRSAAGRDDAALDTGCLAGLHDVCRAVDGRWNQVLLVL